MRNLSAAVLVIFATASRSATGTSLDAYVAVASRWWSRSRSTSSNGLGVNLRPYSATSSRCGPAWVRVRSSVAACRVGARRCLAAFRCGFCAVSCGSKECRGGWRARSVHRSSVAINPRHHLCPW